MITNMNINKSFDEFFKISRRPFYTTHSRKFVIVMYSKYAMKLRVISFLRFEFSLSSRQHYF